MQPIPESFSLVILGSWNPSIFSPDWIVSNLLETSNCDVQVAFPVDDPTAPRRIAFEDVVLFPGRRQLTLSSVVPNLVGMQKCSSLITKILDLLIHTPVSSAGINFSFLEKEPTEAMDSALMPSDSSWILDDYPIKETKIQRVLKKDIDANILNFTLSQNEKGCALSFNFHYDIGSVVGYKELFSGNAVEKHFNEALTFSKKCYDIELENNDEE